MKVILDLCGGTGAWSKPYADNGFDVQVITHPFHDVERIMFYDDCMIFWSNNMLAKNVEVKYSDVYGILAAPPCTEFSVAKNGKHRERDFEEGMKTVRYCMDIIWTIQEKKRLKFWALENPRGLLRRFLGVPKYTFEQWQFGGKYIKATDVWGYFNIPARTVRKKPEGMTVRQPSGRTISKFWGIRETPEEHSAYLSMFDSDGKRAAIRAITPAGFAEAFYKANGGRD